MTGVGLAEHMSQRLKDSPLYQLVQLKLGRMLYGAHPDSEDVDAVLGVALAVLTLPGAFLSLLLFNKYGSLLRFLRGQVKFDPYAASLPDEYLFIVLAMLVSGGVALWKWDSLSLDRRDTVNIVPLPVRTRQIFIGNLVAVVLFATIFCIDVNAASAVLFPLVVSASQESFLFFGHIAIGHGLAILAASLFSFATIFAVAGVCMASLSARLFQALSLSIRGVLAVALLLLLSSAFTVSHQIAQGEVARDFQLRYLPSLWFLGICQWARGAADTTFRHLACMGAAGLIVMVLVGAAAYGIAYKRHFSRMLETSAKPMSGDSWGVSSMLEHLLDRTVMRSSFEQAASGFIFRTLVRSDRHRAAVAVFVAVGFVAAGQYVAWSVLDPKGPNTAQFAAPLVVLYCSIFGLRYAFDMPVELNANWIFRLLIAPTLDECAVLAGKVIFLFVAPLITLVSLGFAFRWTMVLGLLQAVVLAVLSATLIAGAVLTFRKLPFTCDKAGFQQNALLKILLFALGICCFAILPASIETWAIPNPVRLLVLAPLLALVWWGIYERHVAQLEIDRQIVFHDPSQNEIALLNLSA